MRKERSLTLIESAEEETKIKDCLKRRKVKSCEQCCRYEECYNGKSVDWDLTTMVKLGNAIIQQIGEDYCKAYKNGNRAKYLHYKQILRSTYPDILTANKTNGEALEELLKSRCKKYYGDFEEIVSKRKNKYLALIKEQKKLLQQTTDIHKRKHIRAKIYKLEGEMNE